MINCLNFNICISSRLISIVDFPLYGSYFVPCSYDWYFLLDARHYLTLLVARYFCLPINILVSYFVMQLSHLERVWSFDVFHLRLISPNNAQYKESHYWGKILVMILPNALWILFLQAGPMGVVPLLLLDASFSSLVWFPQSMNSSAPKGILEANAPHVSRVLTQFGSLLKRIGSLISCLVNFSCSHLSGVSASSS